MRRKRSGKTIFVTGTDTGVGKTLLTALLLHHLRQSGVRALAMKPFCSGGRADVELLQSLQKGELSDEEANPFYFPEPVAPLVSSKRHRRRIALAEVVAKIRHVENKCDRFLIEGSGGIFVPLGQGYMVADLISALRTRIIIVARNRLGTLNHTLLTVKALQDSGLRHISIVLMDSKTADYSSTTNQKILQELLGMRVHKLPFLGVNMTQAKAIKDSHKKVKKVLAQILR